MTGLYVGLKATATKRRPFHSRRPTRNQAPRNDVPVPRPIARSGRCLVTDEPKPRPVRRSRIGFLGGWLAFLAIAVAALIGCGTGTGSVPWRKPGLREPRTRGYHRSAGRGPGWIAGHAYGVKIANPPGFPARPDYAQTGAQGDAQTAAQGGAFITIPRLSFDFDPANGGTPAN